MGELDRIKVTDHVAVIGLRWDRSADLAAAFATAGHPVTGIHLGSYDYSGVPEPSQEALDGVDLDGMVETIGRGIVIDALDDQGWAAVAPLLADVDMVVLDRWHGWVEYEVARDALAWARDHDRILIALESPHEGADQTVRWLDRWAQEIDAVHVLTVLRPPPGMEPTPWTTDAGLLQQLYRNGWRKETVASVDAEADALHEQGIRLAGRLWTPTNSTAGGGLWVQLAGSATTFVPPADSSEPWRDVNHWTDLSRKGGGLVIRLPEDCGVAMSTSVNEEGDVDAVRLAGDTDAFEGEAPLISLTTLELSDGVLVAGDPGDPDRVVTQPLRPGTYVVQEVKGDASGLQLQWIPPSTNRAPRVAMGCRVCGERQVPIVYGYPGSEMFEAAERGEIAIGGCMPILLDGPERCDRGGSWLTKTRKGWEAIPEQIPSWQQLLP